MVIVVATLLLAQLAGEALVRATGLPVPGPVLGMLLVFGLQILRERNRAVFPAALTDGSLESLCRTLLAQLSLLFVPAGVGVIQRMDLLGKHALELGLALTVSTVLGIAAAAAAFRVTARLTGSNEDMP